MASVAFITAALSGCAGGRQEIGYEPPKVERYTNHIEIDGQWGANGATGANGQYGVGDPFVMRFNGKYYLYPSTSDPENGIKVFESDDLVHWTYKGLAVAESELTSHGAYAPEVVYYNGYFYLCQSRGGNGHYIYRSESPAEGFTLFSKSEGGAEEDLNYGNLGMGIDGSFYVSDEGKLYLLHTSTPAGLKYNEICDPENISGLTIGPTYDLSASSLGGWIEGPGTIRRGSFTYLTYTGNHVISKGYRIGYSYAEDMTDLQSFILPEDNVTIMDTDDGHYGLGHSSNTVGPDLDSIYTAYHSLVGNGPARRYNVDRYFASGALLTADGVTHRPVAMPKQADGCGYAERLVHENGVYAIGSAEGYFTAEYNFIPNSNQELVCGAYRIRFADGKAYLLKNGAAIAQAQITLPENKLACVRVENGDGVGYVYVNGMRVITYEAESAAGQIGYLTAEGVGYTAFSNDVFGTSDFEAFKNFPTRFPAASYLKGELRGFSIKNAKRVKGGVRVGEKESTKRIDDYYAVSLQKSDWVKYAVDVEKDGTYLICAEVSKESAGAQLTITIGDKTLQATVPAMDEADGGTVRVSLGSMVIEAGVQTMKVQVTKGKADLVWFEALEQEDGNVSLSSYRAFGSTALSNGVLSVKNNGATAGAAVFKNSNLSDFEATVVFQTEIGVTSNVGFMLRAAHYSQFSEQPSQSWRGYYLQIASSLMSLRKYDYGDLGTLDAERISSISFTGNSHTLTLRAKGHKFYALLDGEVALSVEDEYAFFGGELGVYAGNGEIKILSITYKKI